MTSPAHSIRNGSQLKAMCSVATIVMNGQLEFHSQRQPKPSPFTTHPMNDPTPNALLQITYYKPATVLSLNQVISLHLKHWTSHRETHFLG